MKLTKKSTSMMLEVTAAFLLLLVVSPVALCDNAARVRRDESLLLEAEEWLSRYEVRRFMGKQIYKVAEALKEDEEKSTYGVEFSPKLGNTHEVPGGPWPEAVGTVRVTGFRAGAVFRIYETHPNSTQRMRVVRGTGTWYLLIPETGEWEATTLSASALYTAPLPASELASAYEIGDPEHQHFLTASEDDGEMIVLCWHAAGEVEDVHIKWDEQPEDVLDAISPYWREFGGGGSKVDEL